MHADQTTKTDSPLKRTLLSLFPPYLIGLIFFPIFVGVYYNYRLVSPAEPFIMLSLITFLILLRYLSGKNIFYFLATVLVLINGFIMLTHWIILKGPLTSNSMYVVFNTNYEEAGGFLNVNSGYEFLLLLPFIILFILSLEYTFKYPRIRGRKELYILSTVVLIIFVFLTFRVNNGGFRKGVPLLVRSSFFFYKDASGLKKLKAQRKERSDQITAELISPDTPQVFVLIEGESTNRNHMSLYGYHRDTNPLLSKFDDLVVYTDVVSGYPSTWTSITAALTESNLENPVKSYNCFNIMDVCRSSGVRTYWLSNQSPLSFFDNIITLMAEQTDKQEFLNITRALELSDNELPSYDSVLFDALHRALRDDAKQKLIVLHLLGTHTAYHQRYPEEFNHFSGSGKKEKIIAEYDNAVRYNDFVVDSLLKILRNYSEEESIATAAIYVSDHGENVYDDADYRGHYYTDTLYNSILEIPYLVWLSPEYQQSFPEKSALVYKNRNEPYITDDLFHSLIDMLNIQTSVMHEDRSIFSEKYNNRRERRMEDGRIYDHPEHKSVATRDVSF